MPYAQSTLNTFLPLARFSRTVKLVTALFGRRGSQSRTTPSYAPLMNWCSEPVDEDKVARQDGVAGCMKDANGAVVTDDSPRRRSYWHTLLSVDAAKTV